MITFTRGNLFDGSTDAVINPTNTRGPMGAGLAKQFRDRFPGLERAYKTACNSSTPDNPILGRAWLWTPTPSVPAHPLILCLPTKDHWRDPSRWDWIAAALRTIPTILPATAAPNLSIAVPPLGCGLGGLHWSAVKPSLSAVLATMPQIHWIIYEQ